MSNINTIRLSGTTYQIEDSNAPKTVELTQAQYDALVNKDPNTFYVITDAEAGDLTNYYTKSETNTLLGDKADTATTYTKTEVDTALASKQTTLTAGTGINITDNVISATGGGGGGKAVSGGTNISITTGETADTINCTLPIITSVGNTSVSFGNGSTINSELSCSVGYANTVGSSRYVGRYSMAVGFGNTTEANVQFVTGYGNRLLNVYEFGSGQFNNSVSGSSTFGDSGNTLFSVGNGTADNARHNAFEIRQNGDIYLTKDGQDVKLQDQLGGGGGSSYTAGDGIDITNDVISVTGKASTSAVTAIQDSLSGYVTTDTEQIISGRKIFTYSASSSKAIEFKQTSPRNKVGFKVRTSAETNNELASFEFRPNTFTINGVQHPLLYLGHWRDTNTAAAGVPQTYIGFRQYDQPNAAAYHYLIPLPEKAKTPFSLTTSFKDYYAPMGFKNGSTMITTDDTGVVDLSSELGGLKLVKLTQAEYDALAPHYNVNTLYVIVNY